MAAKGSVAIRRKSNAKAELAVTSKEKDISKLEKTKAKLEKLLENNDLSRLERLHKATKFVSRMLNNALTAKLDNEGAVSIDRKTKLVIWACKRMMQQVDDLKLSWPQTNGTFTGENWRAELAETNRIVGDLSRYMSICKSITRSERELKPKELFEVNFWAANSIDHYDYSDLSLGGYDARIKQLFSGSPQALTLAVICNLRKSVGIMSLEKARSLPPTENKTVFAELRVGELVAAQHQIGPLYRHFALGAEETLLQVKTLEVGVNRPSLALEKKLISIRKKWDEISPDQYDPADADYIIIGIVMLAQMLKQVSGTAPPFAFSFLIKAKPLQERVRELINPEQKPGWSSPILEYIFEHTKLEDEIMRIKLQKLNSRPAYF